MVPSTNAVSSLLFEYGRAIGDLKTSLQNITPLQLSAVADHVTKNDDCRSIATVLTHVISSGYSYCIYITESRGCPVHRPAKHLLESVLAYCAALDSMFDSTVQTFQNISDSDLATYEQDRRITTRWGKTYDIEQLFEHAIVHVLRHRRQIDNFKKIL